MPKLLLAILLSQRQLAIYEGFGVGSRFHPSLETLNRSLPFAGMPGYLRIVYAASVNAAFDQASGLGPPKPAPPLLVHMTSVE